eukprot:3980935-Pyramimonas_sp.AAC.1
MRSGHYIAYFKHASAWYLADDAMVTELSAAPADFPCVVSLARRDRGQSEHVQKLQERVQGVKRLRTEAPRPVATPSADQLMPPAASDRAGRGVLARSRPAQPPPDRSGRDRSGRDQCRPGRD